MQVEQLLDEMIMEYKKQKMDIDIQETKCCKNFYIIENEGYLTCENCGVVFSTQTYDMNIFSFENGAGNEYLRSFPSSLYPVASTSSAIEGNSRLSKIVNWNSMPYNEKVIWEVSKYLKNIAENIFSKRVIQDTLEMYKNFYEKSDSFRGENKKGFIATCLYLSAKNNYHIVTPSYIAKLIDIDNKSIIKCIRKYQEIMSEDTKTINSVDFINSLYDKIEEIPKKSRKYCVKICKVVEEDSILGGALPQNICISVVCFVCLEMEAVIDYKKIEELFKTCKTTILKNIKILQKEKQKIFQKIKNSEK